MSPEMRALIDETNFIIQGGFLTATLFLVLYTNWHRWWHTIHGRTLGMLSVAVIAILGRSALVDWHILPPETSVDWSSWLITQFALLLPATFAVMSAQLIHRHTHHQEKRSTLASAYLVPGSWRIYHPARSVGWALSPEGKWFLVNDGAIAADRSDPESSAQLNCWLQAGVLTPASDPMAEGRGEHGLTDRE